MLPSQTPRIQDLAKHEETAKVRQKEKENVDNKIESQKQELKSDKDKNEDMPRTLVEVIICKYIW